MSPETMAQVATAARYALIVLGIGFLGANVRTIAEVVRFNARRKSALLTWQPPRPRYFEMNIMLAIAMGLLIAAKLVMRRPYYEAFGETMMFVYYGIAFPLSTRIARGFYEDGIWSDTGFMRWGQISAVSWKEESGATLLVVISHLKSIARHLQVPGDLYGQARRLLRDKIQAHDIRIGGAGLDLGSRDERDTI
jgi:hypothetical protein